MSTRKKSSRRSVAKKSPVQSMDALWDEAYAHMNSADLNGQHALIETVYRKFIGMFPTHACAHHNLGLVLNAQGRLDEAEQCYRESARLHPVASVYHNMGVLLLKLQRLDEAHDAFEETLRLKPWYPNEIDSQSVHLKKILCKWDGLASRIDVLRRGFSTSVPETAELPNIFIAMAIGASLDEQQRCARRLARDRLQALPDGARFDFNSRDTSARRRRIGYLSADFHDHATAHLTAALFEIHDRRGFEIIAYSNGPDDGSAMQHRLRGAFDGFVYIRAMSDKEAAEKIHADGIDILVDLKGHTTDNRLQIFGYRPAPIQVAFLGFPGPMGAAAFDYVIADPFIVPAHHFQYYDEKVVHLPDCYQPNDPQRVIGAIPTRAEAGLPEAGVVYCSFNQTYKITPCVFDIWMRILSGTPGSVLWILASNRWAADNLRQEARARGIDDDRLVFAPPRPQADHLGRLTLADIFLDTLEVNAHTTASDALWAGVPVLTCPGDTFASRVAGSLLHAMELPELVMPTLADYEQEAITLGQRVMCAAKRRRRFPFHGSSSQSS